MSGNPRTAVAGLGRARFVCGVHLAALWTHTMFKKILVANRGGLAQGKAKQNAPVRTSVRTMSREAAYV